MQWQLNTYLLFVSWVDFFLILYFIIFFIHDIIISYPNDKMDKRFFKNWVLHIPHRLRDLLWMVRAWSSIASIFFFSSYESSFFFFPEFAETNHFLLAHIPWMNEFHDPWRPLKVAITSSALFTSSFTASICSLIWETLVRYDCMVSAF